MLFCLLSDPTIDTVEQCAKFVLTIEHDMATACLRCNELKAKLAFARGRHRHVVTARELVSVASCVSATDRSELLARQETPPVGQPPGLASASEQEAIAVPYLLVADERRTMLFSLVMFASVWFPSGVTCCVVCHVHGFPLHARLTTSDCHCFPCERISRSKWPGVRHAIHIDIVLSLRCG